MRLLAAFVMRGRLQALAAVAVLAALSLVLPPIGLIGAAVVALVTLRQGYAEGLLALVSGAVVGASTANLLIHVPLLAATGYILAHWAQAWLLALVLRATVSLTVAMETAAALGVLGVAAIYLLLGDPAPAWQGLLQQIIVPALEQTGWQAPGVDYRAAMESIARIMTGMVATTLVVGQILSLLLARWWQAQLYNPGGFRQEFHGLRMHRTLAIVGLSGFLAAISFSGLVGSIAADLALLISCLFVFQALALLHHGAAYFAAHIAWLVSLYALLILMFPGSLKLLAALGYADAVLDLRTRLGRIKRPS